MIRLSGKRENVSGRTEVIKLIRILRRRASASSASSPAAHPELTAARIQREEGGIEGGGRGKEKKKSWGREGVNQPE